MIDSASRIRSKAKAPVILVAFLLLGCDPESAKKFDYGRPLPDVRFNVALAEPESRDVLYAKVKRLAKERGFSQVAGIHDPEDPDARRPGFKWRYKGNPKTYASVMFIFELDADNRSPSFNVILYNYGLNPLDVADWIEFGEWRDRLLPTAFPGSEVTVLIDPKPHTDPDQLEQIMAESGVSID